MNINLVLNVMELAPDMIVDRGPDRDRTLPCYHLDAFNLDRVTTVVTELQIFLEQAAGLITEQTSYFTIDPGNTLLPILKGTSSLAQLHVVWLALRCRIKLGSKTWKKYIVEYQLLADSKLTLSLLSTLPELYQPLQDIMELDKKLHYLYRHVPHYQEQLTQEGRNSLERTHSWLDILLIPDTLKNTFSESKVEQPPNLETTVARKRMKGKEKEHQSSSSPATQSSIWMGMDTPFKSANAWFVDPRKSNQVKQAGTSRPHMEPNILLGITTPLQPLTATELAGREQPPHMVDQPQGSAMHRLPDRAESPTGSGTDERQNITHSRGHRESGNDPDRPSSSDDDDNSSRLRCSHPRQS